MRFLQCCGGVPRVVREWDLPSALMTNEQLYLAIGIPVLFNAAMMGLLIA